MKHLKLTSLLLFTLVIIFTSCEKNKTEVFGIKNFTHSGCKNSSNKTLETETITLKTNAVNDLKIKHSNAIFPCCPDGELIAKASLTNDTIVLKEYSTDQTCDCLCPYDLEYTIGEIEHGKYTVSMAYEDYSYFSFTINFNSDTDTTIIINHN